MYLLSNTYLLSDTSSLLHSCLFNNKVKDYNNLDYLYNKMFKYAAFWLNIGKAENDQIDKYIYFEYAAAYLYMVYIIVYAR